MKLFILKKKHYSVSKETNGDDIIINIPAWDKDYFGLKLVSVFPNNNKYQMRDDLRALSIKGVDLSDVQLKDVA